MFSHRGYLLAWTTLVLGLTAGCSGPPASDVPSAPPRAPAVPAESVAEAGSTGTGFIVHTNGYILSSAHVVEDGGNLRVVLHDGSVCHATVIEADDYKDLALLKIEASGLTAAPLGDSGRIRVMDPVLAIGFPLGTVLGRGASAYEGRINALREELKVPLFQTDLPLNPGMSGGPLINERGEVIGVLAGKLGPLVAERVGFAIPVNEAKWLLRRAWPHGIPSPTRTAKRSPQEIFRALKPATVLILKQGRGGAHPAAGKPWENSLGMKFVPVPGADVLVCIWETRVKDYAVYAAENQGVDSAWRNPQWQGVLLTPRNDCPVVNVSWHEANGFCDWLTRKERAEGRLTRWQFYRLPTDLEWSAAVGLRLELGSTPKERNQGIDEVYPWGAYWPPTAGAGNYADETFSGVFGTQWGHVPGYRDDYPATAPVGSFPPNRYGIYDLGGNVWEWCHDVWDRDQPDRVMRGGSWAYHEPKYLLSSHRSHVPPTRRMDNLGFRVVLVVGPSP